MEEQKTLISNTSKDTSLTQISKVDQLGLQSTVATLRRSGLSYLNIANKLNAEVLKETKISTMSILRWCHDNLTEESEEGLGKGQEAINIYNHSTRLLKSIDQQLELLDSFIDDFTHADNKSADILEISKQVTAYMTTYEKLTNRKIALLQSIGVMQEKVYNFQAANKITDVVLSAVKEKDIMLYTEIMKTLKNDPLMLECYRRIKK